MMSIKIHFFVYNVNCIKFAWTAYYLKMQFITLFNVTKLNIYLKCVVIKKVGLYPPLTKVGRGVGGGGGGMFYSPC